MKIHAFIPLATLIARLSIAGTFISAALPKIKAPTEFAVSIEGFELIHSPLVHWVALLLPWLELIIGIGLIVPMIRKVSGALIAGLLILFIGLHASAWQRGLDISCGCFGTDAEPTTNYSLLILRNLLLLAATCFVLFRDLKANRATSKIAI